MTDRVLLGKRTDNTYGLDISLPGYDVKTATEEQLAFSSKWGSAGVVHQSGTSTQGATVTFPDLGYKPFVYCQIYSGSNTLGYVYSESDQSTPPEPFQDLWEYVMPLCTVTNSSITFYDDSYVPAYNVRYYIIRANGG